MSQVSTYKKLNNEPETFRRLDSFGWIFDIDRPVSFVSAIFGSLDLC